MSNREHTEEVKAGERFEFGDNWKSFLEKISEERLTIAEKSLKDMLGIDSMEGKNFLDIGCGSGLFSLAAYNLGARVCSIDFDPKSVECTLQLRNKFNITSDRWTISDGSVLDRAYIRSLGKFDLVYSWGVLHHTGNMNEALHNVVLPLKDECKLFIGIYNDQGSKSRLWHRIKKSYNRNGFYRYSITYLYIFYMVLRMGSLDLSRFRNPFDRYRTYKKNRGMSMYHDWIDWIGGLPFECATPEYIVDFFYSNYGMKLVKIKTTLTSGINEFVFIK